MNTHSHFTSGVATGGWSWSASNSSNSIRLTH
jgi:hypothetical protein